jgi:RHS repeat-associated protein
MGHEIVVRDQNGNWVRGEVYAEDKHVATYLGGMSGTMYFDHANWLGTERMRADISGNVCETIQSLPFGDGETSSGSCGDPSPMHFTGKERDTESNVDNFGARDYMSLYGRWMMPDYSEMPEAVPYADLTNPQTLNLYVLSRENPITFADLDGHDGNGLPTELDITYTAVCGSADAATPNALACGSTAEKGVNSQGAVQATGPENKSQNLSAQQQNLAGTIYNETASLRPQVGKNGKSDPASAASLSNGREATGEVVLNRAAAGKTGGVASSEVSKLGKATSQYADSLTAAKEAITVGGSKTGPQHYYIRSGDLTIVKGKVTAGDQPWWGRGVVPASSYGPFRNPVQAGDVAAGSDIWIDIYHVP